MNEIRILQLDDYDARARPTELETLSRAGAVARFALRRFDPPGEPRRFLHRRPGRTSRYAASLYALCAFRDRAGSRFRYEPTAHLPGCDVPGTSPDCATFDDGAHHFFTTCRLATTRRAIMASDVGRGLREAACRQPKVPCAPTPQGSGTTRDPLLARGPEHPMSLARVRDRLECRTRLGVITPWPTKIFVPAAPREGGNISENQGAWIRFVGTVPVKGCPFLPVVRPPRDAAPRGTLPSWRASAGLTFSSRPTLNA